MKKIIFFIALTFFIACSKDLIDQEPIDHIVPPNDTPPIDTTSLEYFYATHCYGYKVKDTTALIVMGRSEKIPDTAIHGKEGSAFLSGTRNGKLWIAGFDTESKEQNFEFVDSKPMELKYKLHLGYGEYKDVMISKTDVKYIIDNAPNLITILRVYDGNSNTSNAEYITFFTPSTSKTFLTQNRYNAPIEWYNETYIFSGLSIDDPYNYEGYTCMDQKGDTIFTHTGNDNFFDDGRVFPISYKEIIFFDSYFIESKPALRISRQNIDNPYIGSAWEILTPISNWLYNAKYSITKEEISETIWKFTVDLVWYNGEKEHYSYQININTGESINNQ